MCLKDEKSGKIGGGGVTRNKLYKSVSLKESKSLSSFYDSFANNNLLLSRYTIVLYNNIDFTFLPDYNCENETGPENCLAHRFHLRDIQQNSLNSSRSGANVSCDRSEFIIYSP